MRKKLYKTIERLKQRGWNADTTLIKELTKMADDRSYGSDSIIKDLFEAFWL